MRVTEGYDESMLQHKVFVIIDPNKGARSIAEVSKVVLFIKLLILNDHVPFAYTTECDTVGLSIRVIYSLHFTVYYS